MTTYSDSFTYSDGQLSTVSSGVWVNRNNSIDILSGQFYDGTGTSNSWAEVSTSTADFSDDHEAQITVAAVGNFDTLGPCVRSTASGCYAINADNVNANTKRIVRMDGTTKTTIGTVNITVAANDTLKLKVVGSTITAYKNGSQVDSVTDTTYTSGQPGIFYHRGNTNVSRGDSFVAADITAGLSITSVDTDNAVLASQSQATFAGSGLASTAKFAVKRGSAIAYGADISLSGSTGGSFTAPTMTAMFSAGVRFGDVAFYAAEASGTAIASISGSITTATNWKYVNVTDLSATGSMGSLFYNNAVSLSDQVAYSSVTTRFRWPVTVSGDGYFTVNSSGSQAGDEFAYRIWDETDSTWGTEGTIEVNGGISSAEQVYAAGSLVQASLESSTLEGATLQ